SGSRRKRLLTSITAAPAAAARGACSPATPGPAAKKASSTPSKACGVRSAIFSLRPASSTSAPAVRCVPRRRIEPAGNWRCPSSSSISRPTSPAGPTTAIVSSVAIPGSVAQDSDPCKDPRIAEAGGGGGTGTLSLRGGVRRRCSALLPVAGPGRTRRLLSLGEIPATRFVRQLPCRREPLGARAACVNILADERVQNTERPDGKEPRSVRSHRWITRHEHGHPAGFRPLLVMDVWEHAFLVDYKPTERSRYIEAFFANVDWRTVEGRFARGEAEATRARPA